MPMFRAMTLFFFLVLAAVLPLWPYSQGWGGKPAVTIVSLFLIMAVLKRLRLL